MLASAHVITLISLAIALWFLQGGHTEDLETTVFVALFVIVLPLAVTLAAIQARRAEQMPGRSSLSLLALGNSVAATMLVLAAWWAYAPTPVPAVGAAPVPPPTVQSGFVLAGTPRVLLFGAVFILLANIAASGLRRPAWLDRIAPQWRQVAVGMCIAISLTAVAPFLGPTHRSVPMLVLALAGGAAIAALWLATVSRFPRLAWRRTVAVDIVVALAVLSLAGVMDYVDARHHNNFYLGPVNDVVHGKEVLIDTFSQYGVGVIYFLAAIFSVVELSYGKFRIVLDALVGLQFVVVLVFLRTAMESRFLAWTSVSLAAALTVPYAVLLPSTGPLRFGPAFVLLAVSSLAWRSEGSWRRVWRVAQLATVGATTVWSIETGFYGVAVFVALAAYEAFVTFGARRRRALVFVRELALLAAAAAIAHLGLATYIRLAGGEWPDWGTYALYVKLYSADEFFTLPIPDWSATLLLPIAYVASSVGVWLAATRHADFARRRRVELGAIVGATVLGAAAYTYFLGRSHWENGFLVVMPAILVAALWLDIASVGADRLRIAGRHIIAGLALAAAMLLAYPVNTHVRHTYNHSALGLAVSGRPPKVSPWGIMNAVPVRGSLSTQWALLTTSPPFDPNTEVAERFVNRHLPKSGGVLVLLPADTQTELQIRLGRTNLLPIGHPDQDELLLERTKERIQPAIDGIEPGTRVVTLYSPTLLLPLQRGIYDQLSNRFDKKLLAIDHEPFDPQYQVAAFELVERAPGTELPPAA